MTNTETVKLPFGPVNIENFQLLKQHILASPMNFNMFDYEYKNEACETVCCLCGWANYLASEDKDRVEFASHRKACEFLGFPITSSTQLFYYDAWHKPFVDEFIATNKLKDRPERRIAQAKIAARYIDYICYGVV